MKFKSKIFIIIMFCFCCSFFTVKSNAFTPTEIVQELNFTVKHENGILSIEGLENIESDYMYICSFSTTDDTFCGDSIDFHMINNKYILYDNSRTIDIERSRKMYDWDKWDSNYNNKLNIYIVEKSNNPTEEMYYKVYAAGCVEIPYIYKIHIYGKLSNYDKFITSTDIIEPDIGGEKNFIGWYAYSVVEELGGIKINSTKDIIDNANGYGCNLIALWEEDIQTEFKVMFATDGGTKIPNQIVSTGNTATEPTPPIKPGYSFGGWYEDIPCTEPFDFSTPIKRERIFYAKWVANTGTQYSVAFNTNGGSSISSQIVAKGNTVIKPENPVKDGYVFNGWYADESFETLFDFKTPIISDININAKWSAVVKDKYMIIDGAKQEFVKDNGNIAKFRINADYMTFVAVYIDENLVSSTNYTITNGSTIITFTENFMKSLNEGSHKLEATFTDGGMASTTFEVKKKISNSSTTTIPAAGSNPTENLPVSGGSSNIITTSGTNGQVNSLGNEKVLGTDVTSPKTGDTILTDLITLTLSMTTTLILIVKKI